MNKNEYEDNLKDSRVSFDMIEAGCRAICVANHIDPDARQTYPGGKLARNQRGSTYPIWQAYDEQVRIALQAVLDNDAFVALLPKAEPREQLYLVRCPSGALFGYDFDDLEAGETHPSLYGLTKERAEEKAKRMTEISGKKFHENSRPFTVVRFRANRLWLGVDELGDES